MASNTRNYLVSLVRPEDVAQRSMPRVDALVMTAAVLGGIVIAAMDIFQRWIWNRPIEQLNIDGEFNIPSWFHVIILAGAAMCAIGIAFTFFDNRRRLMWLAAGSGIAFFSLDKSVALHEKVGDALKDRLGLPFAADRIAWEVVWAPIILVTAIALIMCVWEANTTTKLWVALGLALGASKIFSEAMTFLLLHFNVTSYTEDVTARSGTLYDAIKLTEKSVQLLAFSAFFAGFAQLFVDRLFALARGEDAEQAVEVSPVTNSPPSVRAGRAARPDLVR